ncbi:MAG: pentapeptide repeat-containing protein, partial [Candidatus Rokubacteria bacterium]|nr:pentapeptide repeat-containing protein [Candidatus Rokubacteria bacterium]
EASFNEAAFGGGARFIRATFGEGADFLTAALHGGASFYRAKFERRCAFAGRRPTPEDQPEDQAEYPLFFPSGEIDFRNVQIEEPRKFQFRHVNLSRVSFLGTDLRGVDFLDCRFARWKGRKALYDEETHCRTGKPPETLETNLRLTQSLYQQLKRNFEENRDFAQAGAFHFGEMEMRRLQVPGYRRWLSVLQWYKWASGYGEYYRRAFWVFLGIVLVFTLAFSFSPNVIGQKKDQNFAGLPSVVEVSGNWEKAGRVWDSFVYSFRAASLLRALPSAPGAEIYPASRWGVALAVPLSVLGPVQLALFFLALRRHVRR